MATTKKKPYHRRRHVGVRNKESNEDIAAAFSIVKSGLIKDGQFYELINWELMKLGFTPLTKKRFEELIIEPARNQAIENQQRAIDKALLDAKRGEEMLAQQDRQIRIKELEQEKKIKELEAEVLGRDIKLKTLREQMGIKGEE